MTKRLVYVTVGLWVAVVASALGVVGTTYKARTYTHQLEKLRHQSADLHVESGKLLLEESSLGSYVRIEEIAKDKLDMHLPDVGRVVIVQP